MVFKIAKKSSWDDFFNAPTEMLTTIKILILLFYQYWSTTSVCKQRSSWDPIPLPLALSERDPRSYGLIIVHATIHTQKHKLTPTKPRHTLTPPHQKIQHTKIEPLSSLTRSAPKIFLSSKSYSLTYTVSRHINKI